MKRESKLRLSVIAICVVSAALIGCAGEVEDPGFTHVIDPSALMMFQADGSLESIEDVAVAGSGEVWALQRVRAPHLFVFSPEGDLLNSFAQTGGARRELSNPISLMPAEEVQWPMAVWDAGNRRISTFNPYGRASVVQATRSQGRTIYREIQQHSYSKPLAMDRFGDHYLLMDHSDGVAYTADYLHSELLRLGLNGELVDTLVDFDAVLADSIATLGRDVQYLAPVPLWSVCPNDELAVFDPFTRAVAFHGTDGALLATETVPIPVHEMTRETQETFLLHMFRLRWMEERPEEPDSTVLANSVEEHLTRHWDQFPTIDPPAVGMMCAGAREVWLQEFSTADHPLGLGNRWLVHTPGSVERVYVQFPDGFRPLRMIDRVVYGVAMADAGVDVVARVAVPDRIEVPAGEDH